MQKINDIFNLPQLSQVSPMTQQESLQQMKNVIQKNEETKNLKLNDKEDIILVYNYLQQKDIQNNLGYQMRLQTEPYLSIVYQETIHSQRISFEKTIQKKHLLFHQKHNFQNIKALNVADFKNNVTSRLQILKKHWKHFQNYTQKPSLYLQGDFETGKTYFFKLMMRSFLQQQQEFLFLFTPDLPRQFKQTWFDEYGDRKMTCLKETKYLFLDDLGAENCTIYFRDDILYPVLNYRQENGLITFISSNLDLAQLVKHFSINAAEQQEIKALRLVHKIKTMCQFYRFNLVEKELENENRLETK